VDKQILSNLKPLVSHQHHLNKYIDVLIEQQHKTMEQAKDMHIIYACQGSIAMLRRLKLLRDEVNGKEKN
jgi:poly-beta-hydroxyalkanoate depolymerase